MYTYHFVDWCSQPVTCFAKCAESEIVLGHMKKVTKLISLYCKYLPVIHGLAMIPYTRLLAQMS